jgi:transposase
VLFYVWLALEVALCIGVLQCIMRFLFLRILHAMLPIRRSHLASFDCMKSVSDSVQFQASRANRAWVCEVHEILATLSDTQVLKKLKLGGTAVGGAQLASDESKNYAHIFSALCINMASARAWSMLYHELPPESFAGILDRNDIHAGAECLSRMKQLARAVNKAHTFISDLEYQECEACLG